MVIHGTQPLQRNRTEPLTLDNLPLVHQSAKIQPDSISSVPTLKGESTWKGPVSAERVVICFAFKRLAVCCFFTPVVFDKVVANRKACLLSLLKTENIYISYILLYCIAFCSSLRQSQQQWECSATELGLCRLYGCAASHVPKGQWTASGNHMKPHQTLWISTC